MTAPNKKAADMSVKELAAYIDRFSSPNSLRARQPGFASSAISGSARQPPRPKFCRRKNTAVISKFKISTSWRITVGFVPANGRQSPKTTSAGFLTGHEAHGATPEIINVLLDTCGDRIKVKGSGCISTREHFLQLIDMGIDRMGVGYRSTPVVLGVK